jgi:hypothetical protein
VDPGLTALSEEDAVLAPRMGKADHFVFLAVQWMKRVRYTEVLRITATTGS